MPCGFESHQSYHFYMNEKEIKNHQDFINKHKPNCPDCGQFVLTCQAPIPELGPSAICGVWECALTEHFMTDCPAPSSIEYRKEIEARRFKIKTNT